MQIFAGYSWPAVLATVKLFRTEQKFHSFGKFVKMSRIFSYADVVKKRRMNESRKNPFFVLCLSIFWMC